MRLVKWTLIPLAALSLTAAADPGTFTLERVLERLRPPGGEMKTAYRQTRESNLLSEATTTQGHLEFRAPDRLVRLEKRPDGTTRRLRIADGMVRLEGPGERQSSFPLERVPALTLLMDMLQSVATGDPEPLRARYDARLEGDWQNWRIHLQLPEQDTQPGIDAPPESSGEAQAALHGSGGRVTAFTMDSSASGRLRIEFLPGATSE